MDFIDDHERQTTHSYLARIFRSTGMSNARELLQPPYSGKNSQADQFCSFRILTCDKLPNSRYVRNAATRKPYLHAQGRPRTFSTSSSVANKPFFTSSRA